MQHLLSSTFFGIFFFSKIFDIILDFRVISKKATIYYASHLTCELSAFQLSKPRHSYPKTSVLLSFQIVALQSSINPVVFDPYTPEVILVNKKQIFAKEILVGTIETFQHFFNPFLVLLSPINSSSFFLIWKFSQHFKYELQYLELLVPFRTNLLRILLFIHTSHQS